MRSGPPVDHEDFAPSWFDPVAPADAAPAARGSRALANVASFSRIWSAFMGARVLIAAVLLLLQIFVWVSGSGERDWLLLLSTFHVLACVLVQWLGRPATSPRGDVWQWLITAGVDIAVFATLHWFQRSGISYTPLFVLPVLLSSILGPLLMALASAAATTLVLLGFAWWTNLQAATEATTSYLQAGLTGTGFFLVAVLAHQLALRLSREEEAAVQGRRAARSQRMVNALIVRGLSEGVLVVDRHGHSWHANPSATAMLADDEVGDEVEVTALPAWSAITDLVRQAFWLGHPLQTELVIEPHPGVTRRLFARTHLTDDSSVDSEGLCVVFLEDLREVEARVRNEKLAAMGRMSAAVAHEIRNPLAAISQANALLGEDARDATQQRLSTMIAQNAQRLARIVDDILNLTRSDPRLAQDSGMTLRLDDSVWQVLDEWSTQHRAATCTTWSAGCADLRVRFDPEHLRRVLINLLDNALRYATGAPGSIQVWSRQEASGQGVLAVWSDGTPIEAGMRQHLFEPFFSSESRSSGLGLFICRELCDRYGASLGYRRALRSGQEGNEFFVLLPPLPPGSWALPEPPGAG